MPTFLTNAKMHPALAARVEASLRSARGGGPRTRGPVGAIAILRLLMLVSVVGGAILFVTAERRSRRELEHAKSALLEVVRRETARLGPGANALVASARTALERESRDYEGDFVDAGLSKPVTLKAQLSRPAVYVRGPIEAFAKGSALEKTAAESTLDSVPLCLLDPPDSSTEAAIKRKVQSTRGSPGPANLRRLHDAFVAVAYLGSSWSARIGDARSAADVATLETHWRRADLEARRPAVSAELLIYVIDEPKTPGTVSELDGATVHLARFGVVELATGKTLWRARQGMDPTWISEVGRARYASSYDGCRLAFDISQRL